MLILGAMARIGIHDYLSVGQMLDQDKRIDWRDDNILVAMNDKSAMRDVLQGGVSAACWYGTPFSNGGKLRHGRVSRYRTVTIFSAGFESLHILATCPLADLGRREERSQ